ncbi:helix-turn-helix domain-containing protein [Brevundimonas sp. UBA7664]|jgi:transcriptional regulator with XRE-family HTH domain|uniref:helix-turn-helix domain-containing protein n=1 Tax=Brevundimonas sp. UBA7664 TaxID=1946141 RepID=UPI0025BE5B07|nr:helix-turn-helix transcriptional regulator [Brevundimonas sp. UBA7664]
MPRGKPNGPDPIDVAVGQAIAARRLRLGFNQTQLGSAIGVTFQQIQKYEKGANRVSASMLVRTARFLRCAPADLLPVGEPSAETDPAMAVIATRQGAELIDLFGDMADDQKASMLSVARAIASATALKGALKDAA